MPIALMPLSKSDFDAVRHLRVTAAQQVYSGTIDTVFHVDEPQVDYHQITRAGKVVGFFKIDRAYRINHSFAKEGAIGLKSVIIDLAQQGQGIGGEAVRQLPDYVTKHYPEATSIYLAVNLRNPAAFRIYEMGGFNVAEDLYLGGSAGPQNVMWLDLREAASDT